MKKLILLTPGIVLSVSLFLLSCNNNASKNTENKKDSLTTSQSSMKQQPFGNTDNKEISQYTLTNSKGMVVRIINYGGIVTNIRVPDKNGTMGDVVLGYDSLSGYLQKGNPYFGALVGRYANRIAN